MIDNFKSVAPICDCPFLQAGKFICDIGGLLGLWIGFSFLTVFEFVELLFDVILASVFRAGLPASKNKVQNCVRKLPRSQATLPHYWRQQRLVTERFDPDYRECFSAETPSGVELKLHTPSPELLYDNENDDVSVLDLESRNTGGNT